ncbi:sigma-54 interaction domain-containing protein [Methylogaea oryzae]|uniref:Sigma-54-dependent Fis family transcriptional regulator n=1 Tax=Methylogaea oryzae TaxID=1295382 RepID=A0A8D4VRS7_9GAMM|nr:sigma 54-interacting transcriptional regulator [Methylogaea oryzae]BBL71200.1 hypothetical protein MoryE10_18060 [Methylogaea oryzae]
MRLLAQALAELLDEPVVAGAEGKVVLANRAAASLLGCEAESLIGRAMHEVMQFECAFGEGEVDLHCSLVLPGGRRLWGRRREIDWGERGRAVRFTPDPAAVGEPTDADGVVNFHGLITRDPALRHTFTVIRNVAQSDATVLVRGESGTGKELVARAIHEESNRRDQPFLAINCAALTPSLLDSELFGHVRGAFTGAIKDHAGLFQRADGGTLFLDEVAELPLELQAKLLRVLQERSFIPVGGSRGVTVDVRIVAATHRSLREAVRGGSFREDLMYRLRVVPLFLPPLRERRQDVSLLLWHFIGQHNAVGVRRVECIAPEAMRALLDHPWPGNVRELKNVVEYAFAVGRGAELRLDELPPEFREAAVPSASPLAARGAGDEAERIRSALREAGGRVDEAARLLGVSRATFWRKRKRAGV